MLLYYYRVGHFELNLFQNATFRSTRIIFKISEITRKKNASDGDWTHDPWFTRPVLYHWATQAVSQLEKEFVNRTNKINFFVAFWPIFLALYLNPKFELICSWSSKDSWKDDFCLLWIATAEQIHLVRKTPLHSIKFC